MPIRATRMTMGELRAAPFRIVFDMSPIWDRMSREFADVATDVLDEEMRDIAIEMGKEMLRNIRRFALPRSLTGRLADARVPARGGTWRYWTGPVRGLRGGRTGRYLTVGLHTPAEVSPDIGRPVSMYVHAIERGGKPRYPLGKQARERIKFWAARRGLTATQAHHIARAIYLRGTDAHPFFTPAARATVQGATRWLEDGGRNWRDRVEAHFGVSQIWTGQYVG